MKTFIVLNPKAGNTDPRAVRAALEAHLEPDTYEVYETTAGEDLVPVVAAAREAGAERIVASGGDGTISALAHAMAGSDLPLGVIPAGSGNTLARDLGIPLDPGQAVALLTGESQTRSVDVLEAAGHWLLVRLAAGFEATVVNETERADKRRMGGGAYLVSAVKQYAGLRPVHATITVDGERHHFRHVHNVVLVNSAILGPPPLNLRLGQKIRPDDGVIDVVVLKEQSLVEYAEMVVQAHTGGLDLPDSEGVFSLPARHEITVETSRPMPVHGDGEDLGETPVTAVVIPQAIEIIVPPAT